MDIDSLINQFQFRNDKGKFFFNDEQIMDIDSLEEALKDKFDHFNFDFDFKDWNDEDVHDVQSYYVRLSRAKVYIQTAREEQEVSRFRGF